MPAFLFLAIKVTVLAVLYGFLYKVFKMIGDDILRSSVKAVRPLPAGIQAELNILESNDPILRPGDVLRLKQIQTTIGRGKNNNINLEDSYISHSHTRILFQDGGFYIEDLGSINGTFVNGIRIDSPVVLQEGDIIKIAGNIFKFVG